MHKHNAVQRSETRVEARDIVRTAARGKCDMELCVIGMLTLYDVLSRSSMKHGENVDSKKKRFEELHCTRNAIATKEI